MSQAAFDNRFLLDVTIRDGGYVNGHSWTADEAASVVQAVDAAGVDYVEVGYLRPQIDDPLRPSLSSPLSYLDHLAARAQQVSLVVMIRPGDARPSDLLPLADHGVGMVRLPIFSGDVGKAAALAEAAHSAGLQVAMNITRVSEIEPARISEIVRRCSVAGADIVYLADSNGSLFPDEVRVRVEAAVDATEVPIGFHPHDNIGLAFINTLTALEAGTGAVDASMSGIGKGGGNLRLELIAAYWIVKGYRTLRLDALAGHVGVTNAKLRMLADGGHSTVVSGLLDINLDQAAAFREEVACSGFDSVLRNAPRDKSRSASSRMNTRRRVRDSAALLRHQHFARGSRLVGERAGPAASPLRHDHEGRLRPQ